VTDTLMQVRHARALESNPEYAAYCKVLDTVLGDDVLAASEPIDKLPVFWLREDLILQGWEERDVTAHNAFLPAGVFVRGEQDPDKSWHFLALTITLPNETFWKQLPGSIQNAMSREDARLIWLADSDYGPVQRFLTVISGEICGPGAVNPNLVENPLAAPGTDAELGTQELVAHFRECVGTTMPVVSDLMHHGYDAFVAEIGKKKGGDTRVLH
jgi:hypothetical protein